MPTPASALPVLIASSNWSVLPPKLIVSTSSPCFVKMPRVSATGTPTVQMALAFQVSFSFLSGPVAVAGAVSATRQIGTPARGSRAERSGAMAPKGMSAAAAPAVRIRRRRTRSG